MGDGTADVASGCGEWEMSGNGKLWLSLCGMKRLLFVFAALMVLVSSVDAGAQQRITTKKYKLGDFTSKTTRVVLSGNPMTDEMLKEEVARRWRISPYEFCSVDEFERSRTSTLYYFLVIRQDVFRDGTAGISYLSVLKGGKAKTDNPDEKAIDVVNVPYSGSPAYAGREAILLPALLDVIQNFITDAMTSPDAAIAGLERYNRINFRGLGQRVLISKSDLNTAAHEAVSNGWDGGDNIEFVEEEDADEALQDGRQKTLISYIVAPSAPHRGSWCYKMLISTDTHELYYFRRHLMTATYDPGFVLRDLKLLAR